MLYCKCLKQKASNWTLFAFIAFSFFTAPLYADNCTVKQFDETVKVAQVYDGDTVRLVDGRKLRVIGINTPERGREGKKDEPFYLEAKKQLQQIISKNNNQIKIVFGKDKRDRYKRYLANIFTMNNENITEILIKNGMGFNIAIPPNIQFLDCYQNSERDAKKNKLGIWKHPFSRAINVTSLNKSSRGFHRVKGLVDRVGESHSSFWLNLNSKQGVKFALRILKKDLPYFTEIYPKDLINKKVTARGWIYEVKNAQRMTIHHPASLELQNAD